MNNQYYFPRDFFSWMLLLFGIGTLTLTGFGQLRAIGILMAGSYTLYLLVKKISVPMEIVILFVWVVWSGTTGYIVSVDKELFFNTFRVVFQILVMSFAISGITAKQRSINYLFYGLLIGGIILFLSGFLSGELIEATDAESQTRVLGLTANSNDFGYSLLITAAVSLYLWGNNVSSKKRVLIILLLAICSLGIIYSGSRKSFMGLILLFALWIFGCYKNAILKKPYLIIGIFLILGAIYATTDYMMNNTFMGKRFQEDFVDNPVVKRREGFSRITLYQEGIDMVIKNPVFGVGLGNFAALSSLDLESHSDYIEVASCTGLIGFILYFSIYVLLWLRFSKIKKLIKDPAILYNVNMFKVIIIMILFVAFSRPNLTAQITWVVLSGIIGYTWSLEKNLSYLKNSYGV